MKKVSPLPKKFKSLPPSGVYHLVLHLGKERRIQVGALGRFVFPAGYYTYTGRSMRALPARVARHARRDKTLRWHIDYFRRHTKFIGVQVIASTKPGDEERLARALLALAQKQTGNNAVPAPGFGASDSSCPAHLFYWGNLSPDFEKIHK
ncbi:MAG: GIY-YIG nuclease family protein [Nitrospinaceae bacterium]|nr:GIY-YIG nuclease family protein [Nitrospinaceae bacterium]MBT3435170.1 GIY-YIG nuclease family protein [Nitrospinaceae bacterium]MBT4094681.1 GIY-YIG nuclease family protein [Nitrospinaceae bacterium]MBT4430593.1 GIY-YIG nuclease family protein [Nitrospinaceae bacterium]MBT5369638.1 GIY-YIG nuclease family protein [Nitrospinaceae bacterium]